MRGTVPGSTMGAAGCNPVAILLSGTMRGFTECAAALHSQLLLPNVQLGVAVHLATYSDRDCQDAKRCSNTGGNRCIERNNLRLRSNTKQVTPDSLRADYALHKVSLQGVLVDKLNASLVALPMQPLFGGSRSHGALERTHSQYLLRSRVLWLGITAGSCRPQVAVVLRPDLEMTSGWSFRRMPSLTPKQPSHEWRLNISFQGGECLHALANNSIVVPRSIEGYAMHIEDYLAAGMLSAVHVYISLGKRISQGSYSHLGSIMKPEHLLEYHLREAGLDLQYACGPQAISSTWNATHPPPRARVEPSRHMVLVPQGYRRGHIITGVGHLFKRATTCGAAPTVLSKSSPSGTTPRTGNSAGRETEGNITRVSKRVFAGT